MTVFSFVDARLKLGRAGEHLEQVRALTDEVASETEVEFDAEKSEYFISKEVPPLPATLSLSIGDFVHNARASLDYAVYELVTRLGKAPPRRGGFPICASTDDFTCHGKPMLAKLPAECIHEVEAM